MKRLLARSSRARSSATSATQASATVTGGIPSQSATNSAGASTNLVEISETLDPLLQALDRDEQLSIAEESVAERLRRVCDTYPQSQVPDGLVQWTCDERTLDLVSLAADCSEAVYDRKAKPQVRSMIRPAESFEEIKSISASLDGSVKATMIRLQESTQTVVVAFRGTNAMNPIDWITNANGSPVEAGEFLLANPDCKVHSGFLFVARSMRATIDSAVTSCGPMVKHVLFTGHSAGGAVASLLFAHFQLSRTFGMRLHCITFGAPPVFHPASLNEMLNTSAWTASAFLAFVAHGDPVARADRTYIKRLLEVYGRAEHNVALSYESPELYNAGKLLMLHDRNPDGDEVDTGVSEITAQVGTLLFGNVKVHAMSQYLLLISAWLRSAIAGTDAG